MNMANWIWAIIGSFTAQNACMLSVTGTRKATRIAAPTRARQPRSTLRPPRNASTPEAGTRNSANGTPAERAYAIVAGAKCEGPDMRKMTTNNARPTGTSAAVRLRVLPKAVRLEYTDGVATDMVVLLVSGLFRSNRPNQLERYPRCGPRG